jgi:hypothetical protein
MTLKIPPDPDFQGSGKVHSIPTKQVLGVYRVPGKVHDD